MVVLVSLQAQQRQLGKHLIGQSGVDEQREPGARIGRHHDLGELLTDPLRGDDRQPIPHLLHRNDDIGCHRESELRGETRGPKHAQRVVGERALR